MRLYFSSQYPIDQILCTNTLINKLNTLKSCFHPFKAQYYKVLYKFKYIETLTLIYSKCIFSENGPVLQNYNPNHFYTIKAMVLEFGHVMYINNTHTMCTLTYI